MTDRERQQLIDKRQRGTQTDEEYRQYLDLLASDPTLYDDKNLHSLLADVVRKDINQQRWNAINTPVINIPATDAQKSTPQPDRWTPVITLVRENSLYLAAAVALIVMGVVALLEITPDRPAGPQLVKTESVDVFAAEAPADSGKAYFGGSSTIGTMAVRWIENRDQATSVQYIYCRDTLTFYLKTRSDTSFLTSQRLLYDSKDRVMLLSRPGSQLMLADTCSAQPNSLPSR